MEQPEFLKETKIIELKGLTKREYFTGLVLQGICSNQHQDIFWFNLKEKVKFSIALADELLKQLETNK